MGNGPRKYSYQTLKKLYGLSGNECAFPGCQAKLVNKKNAVDSNICHIEAANQTGERYNPTMTDKERADYKNLILLCRQHHDETNDVNKYTVEKLEVMKQNHEMRFLHQQLNNNPSMLKNIINAISDISLDEINELDSLNVFDPKQKLKYNGIRSNYALIQEYKVFQGKINSLYDELELQGSIKKEKLLNNVNQIYLTIMGKYVLDADYPLSIIRENSDEIFNEVFEEILLKMENSEIFEENLIVGIKLIMVDAFMRCKIFEEPK